MQKIILFTAILLVAIVAKVNAQNSGSYKYVLDWSYWQPESPNYNMSFEKNPESLDQNIFTIKSVKSKIDGFGTLMKTVQSDSYKGKTVKMSGFVKTEKVKSWAGLWMRVDFYTAQVLAFDNMQNRGIKGTTDWTKYEVVLFVPQEATSISYGVLLDGTGQIWFKDVSLELVGDSVPETGSVKGRNHKTISFETRAKAIANQIKKITDNEKKALKTEIESLDKEVEKGLISKDKAEALKLKKAEQHAAIIEAKIALEEGKLSQLIQDKVDGKFEVEKLIKGGNRKIVLGSNNDFIGGNHEFNITSMKVYHGNEDKENRQSKRTTSQWFLQQV